MDLDAWHERWHRHVSKKGKPYGIDASWPHRTIRVEVLHPDRHARGCETVEILREGQAEYEINPASAG